MTAADFQSVACHVVPSTIEWIASTSSRHGSLLRRFDDGQPSAPPVFVARLWGARVVGHVSAAAVVTADNAILHDVSRDYTGSPGHWLLHNSIRPPVHLNGRTLCLLQPCESYYHWLTEFVPRILLSEQAGFPISTFDHILVSHTSARYIQQLFAMFGINPSRTIAMDAVVHVHADELIVPSMPGTSGAPSRQTLDAVRSRMLPFAAARPPIPPRIYVTRRRAGIRRVVREQLLYPIVRRHGFQIVDLQHYPVQQQIAIFTGSSIVAGPHGAGFTNTIFSPVDTCVFELRSPNYDQRCFEHQSGLLGLRHTTLLSEGGDELSSTRWNHGEDLRVDHSKFRAHLEKLIGQMEHPTEK